jgi:hypothetical protein
MRPLTSQALFAAVSLLTCAAAPTASAQLVYYPAYRPVVVAPVVAAPVVAAPVIAPTYVSNYVPAGNYAAVTAFSPPLVAEPAAIAVRAAYPPAYAPFSAAPVTTSVTTYYAPTAVAAPVAAAPVFAAPAIVPVTTYYAPAAVAVPMRRGIFGGWRPVRGAYAIPY